MSARLSSMRISTTAILLRGWHPKTASAPRILPSPERTGALANEATSSRRIVSLLPVKFGCLDTSGTTTGPSSAKTISKTLRSRGSSRTGSPQYDLIHTRLSSANPSSTVSALKYSAVRRVIASKLGSGSESRIPVEASADSRASSSWQSILPVCNSACGIPAPGPRCAVARTFAGPRHSADFAFKAETRWPQTISIRPRSI